VSIPNGASSIAADSVETFDAELGRVVQAHPGIADAPTGAGHLHDPPAALSAHVRDHRTGELDRANEVDVQLPAQ
jgi:hypothetical protein